MPVKAAPVAVPFSWTGCYIGAVAGYDWGSSDQDFFNGNPAIGGTHVDGGTVGGTIGCNYQTGNWVFGVENDLAWADFKGSDSDIQNAAFTIGTKTTWLDTLRGRVGYAFANYLVYATGGVAFTDVKAFESVAGLPEETISDSLQPAGRSVAASNTPSTATGRPRPNIFTSISAAATRPGSSSTRTRPA